MAEMFQSWQEENPGKSVRKFAKPSVTELPGWLDAHIPNIEKNYPGFFEQWKQAVKHGNQALSQMSAAGLAKRQVGYKLKNFEYVSPFSAHDPSCTLISPVPPAVPAFPVPSNGFTKQFGYDPITNTVLEPSPLLGQVVAGVPAGRAAAAPGIPEIRLGPFPRYPPPSAPSFDLRPQTDQVVPLPSSSSTFASSSNLPPIPRQDVQPRTVAASREAEQIRAESAHEKKIKELEAELQMYRHQDQLRSSQKRHADNSQLKATPLRLGAEPRSRETATIPPSTTRARVYPPDHACEDDERESGDENSQLKANDVPSARSRLPLSTTRSPVSIDVRAAAPTSNFPPVAPPYPMVTQAISIWNPGSRFDSPDSYPMPIANPNPARDLAKYRAQKDSIYALEGFIRQQEAANRQQEAAFRQQELTIRNRENELRSLEAAEDYRSLAAGYHSALPVFVPHRGYWQSPPSSHQCGHQ